MDQKTKKRDSIDDELLKTYFGPGNKQQLNGSAKKSPQEKVSSPKKHFNWPVLFVAAVLIAVVALRFLPGTGFKASSPPAGPIYTAEVPVSLTNIVGEKVLYDFEIDEDGWEIPAWALDKPDHVAITAGISADIASRGTKSLKIVSDFPGNAWTGSLVEIQQFLDLGKYDVISVDFYLPPDAPEGLRAKIIVTVGDEWKFVEMARSVKLEPGKWTNIIASLREDSTDWKRTTVDEAFKSDVRKIALRVESNRKPVYSGPIYVDNILVGTLEVKN